MTRGQRTRPEKRAEAMARVVTGETTVAAAKATGLPQQTVSDIKHEALRYEKEYDYIALVSEYLAENLRSLTAQVRVFGDADWLRKQPAQELGVLHGIQADKALAILAAWRQPDPDDGVRPAIDGAAERVE